MDTDILANGAAKPEPTDGSDASSGGVPTRNKAVSLTTGDPGAQVAARGPDLAPSADDGAAPVSGFPDAPSTGPDRANSGWLDEPPTDRGEQAALIGGSALPGKIYGNSPPGAGLPFTAGQSGDASPIAASGEPVTQSPSTGNGLTRNISVGSISAGWIGDNRDIWDYGQSRGNASGLSAPVPATLQSASSTIQTVTLPGSGLVFVNTYEPNISQNYVNAIIGAENFYQGQISTSLMLDFTFGLANGGVNGFVGENNQNGLNVSYATLKSALISHATSANDAAAIGSLPTTDITFGQGFFIPDALAQALGLSPTIAPGTDDTVFLNSADSYFFNQSSPVAGEFDAVSTLEHEISEGMGRTGGLGLAPDDDWGIVDLFRYSAPGVRDLTGGADGKKAFFSIGGTTLLTQFNNPVQVSGDAADWNPSSIKQQSTLVSGGYDSYGAAPTGMVGIVTATDLSLMDVIGWTLTSQSPPSPPPPPPLPGPPPPPSTLTAAQVNTVYSDVLGRAASAAEQTGWVAAESSGPLSAAQVIADIVNSPEAQLYAWPVVRLYQAAFGRVPDSQPGFAANVDAIDPASGGTVAELQLAADFVASAEFQARYGNPTSTATLTAFIQALYPNVLGRSGSTAEINAWLATGESAAQILIGFANSPEFQAKANPAVASLLTTNALAETIVSGSLFQTAITGTASAQTVSGRSDTADLALLNQYGAAGFATPPEPDHGALVTQPATQTGTTAPNLLTTPQH
jgi:hypothetical protein